MAPNAYKVNWTRTDTNITRERPWGVQGCRGGVTRAHESLQGHAQAERRHRFAIVRVEDTQGVQRLHRHVAEKVACASATPPIQELSETHVQHKHKEHARNCMEHKKLSF